MAELGPESPRGSGPAFFRRRGVLIACAVVLVLLASLLGVTWMLQRLATFPAPPVGAWNESALAAHGGEQVWLEGDGDRVEAWLLPAAAPAPTPVIIDAHGNGELIDMQVDQVAGLRAAGIAVLLIEYPGYGRSGGSPSEATISAAMVAAYDWAARDPRFDGKRIVGYGRSLGGGAMAQLATRRPLAALVLESSFTSLADIVRGFGVPDFLMLNRFDTRLALTKYHGPVLILHGSQDTSIPVAHAKALHAAVPHSELHVFACGHNDCPRHWELVLSFLAANGICRKPEPETADENVPAC
jgi:fermentation-respiration switch protein FrsA (DUF1100 family)